MLTDYPICQGAYVHENKLSLYKRDKVVKENDEGVVCTLKIIIFFSFLWLKYLIGRILEGQDDRFEE